MATPYMTPEELAQFEELLYGYARLPEENLLIKDFSNTYTSRTESEQELSRQLQKLDARKARLLASLSGKKAPIASTATSLGDYNNWIKSVVEDGKFTRSERKLAAAMLGLNKYQAKAFNRAVKSGADTSAYLGNLSRNYYIKDGKLFTQDEDGWDQNYFDAEIAKGDKGWAYSGNDAESFANRYNKAVLDWRNTEGDDFIRYDAATGKYYAKGFNGGAEVDVTNSDWAKAKKDAMADKVAQALKDLGIIYDPTLKLYGYYTKDAQGNPTNKWNTITADWFTKNDELKKNALLLAHGTAVNGYDRTNGFGEYFNIADSNKTDADLLKAIGLKADLIKDFDKKSAEEQQTIRDTVQNAMKKYHLSIMEGKDALQSWNEGVMADAWWKAALDRYNKPGGTSWMGQLSWAPGGRYDSYANLGTLPTNTGAGIAGDLLGYQRKNGGTLNIRKVKTAYKKGGQILYAGWGQRLLGNGWGTAIDTGFGFLPIFNTINESSAKAVELGELGKTWYKDGDFWKTLATNAALDALGPLAKGLKVATTAAKLYRGANGAIKGTEAAIKNFNKAEKAYNTARQGMSTYLERYATNKGFRKGTKEFERAMTEEFERRAPKIAENYRKTFNKAASALAQSVGAVKMTEKEAFNAARALNPGILGWAFGPGKWGAAGVGMGKTMIKGMSNNYFNNLDQQNQPIDQNTGYVQTLTLSTYSLTPESTIIPSLSDAEKFRSAQVTFRKQGGNLNMNNINYFLEGGAMTPQAAPAAAPAQGGQDIQAQVMQLVLAAMSGDQLATQTIEQIMQAAQQGDLQAALIAQLIQEIAQLMQGQAQAAKRGAKLSYLRSLKSGCPEGTEAKYYKKGGRVCKECVKKACNGSKTMKAQNGADIEEKKCGGKARKHQEGGSARLSLGDRVRNGFNTAVNALSPGEAITNPLSLAAASRQLFGVVGDAVNPASAVRTLGQNIRTAYDTVTNPRSSVANKAAAVGNATLTTIAPIPSGTKALITGLQTLLRK